MWFRFKTEAQTEVAFNIDHVSIVESEVDNSGNAVLVEVTFTNESQITISNPADAQRFYREMFVSRERVE